MLKVISNYYNLVIEPKVFNSEYVNNRIYNWSTCPHTHTNRMKGQLGQEATMNWRTLG